MNRAFIAMVASAIVLAMPVGAGEARGLQQTAPTLGSAASFAVLGGSTVTNSGATTVNGDLGVSPGSAVTGFPPGVVTGGTIHANDALAVQAQSGVTTAYNNLAGQPCTADLTGQDLGGRTLTAGVYCFASTAQLTGTLTLNAQNNASAVFIFKIGSTLTTASAASVLMINGGSPCNVFWQVGSSATLGATTTLIGNILALTSISLTTGARVSGRTLARNGAVTLDTNDVSFAACALQAATATSTAVATGTATASPTATSAATLPAATQTAVTAATATAITAATATAIATLPPATQTAVIGATNTAVTAATATSVTVATATAVGVATQTAVAAANQTAIAATATARPVAPVPVAQPQGGGGGPAPAAAPSVAASTPVIPLRPQGASTPAEGPALTATATAATPATPAPAAAATPFRLPSALPRTGEGPEWAGNLAALLGGLALVTLGLRRMMSPRRTR